MVLLLVFEIGEVVLVVEFLSFYPVALYFWAGILVWHPARSFISPLYHFCDVFDDG